MGARLAERRGCPRVRPAPNGADARGAPRHARRVPKGVVGFSALLGGPEYSRKRPVALLQLLRPVSVECVLSLC